MSRLYSVVLLNKAQLRDIKISSVLHRNFNIDNYIHKGNFEYIFCLDNTLNEKLSLNALIYKTIGGAVRFKNKLRNSDRYKLRYPIRQDDGSWVKSLTGIKYKLCIIDITEKWDNLIDSKIEESYNQHILEKNRLLLKKSLK